ncbi:hypothetical protein [Leptospira stimsonii]|uniref:Apea-like HEPN domain-containing protein n=1 Tax=Leptospira stimsonii TaxID=2202203 RepID=A0A396YQ15_9LEPT|nr:hypothetical protein [Leptospira stimsonii]RHX83617.1 hypothetical protein DLM75_23875 [Leptospira stimsonii]
MLQDQYSFAFPITVNYTESKATYSFFNSTSISASEIIFKSKIDNSFITFKLCEPQELDEDEDLEQIFLSVDGIIENNYENAFERAFELCNLFINFYLFHQFENFFDKDLLEAKFEILKSQVICLKGQKGDNVRRTHNHQFDIDINNFDESFSIIYHDELLRTIMRSLSELCGPHSDKSKFYSAFMTLEIIEGNCSLKSKSLLSEKEKKDLSKNIKLLFTNIAAETKAILINRSQGFILGRGSDRDSRGERLFYSINEILSGKLPIYFKVTDKEVIEIVTNIVWTRNKLFHNATLDEARFKQDFHNLIILIRSIGRGLIDLKFNPFLPF